MDTKRQQDRMHYPPQEQFFPLQEGNALLPEDHSIMDASPSHAPTAALIENQQTTAVTQQHLLVSKGFLVFRFTASKDPFFPGFENIFTSQELLTEILHSIMDR